MALLSISVVLLCAANVICIDASPIIIPSTIHYFPNLKISVTFNNTNNLKPDEFILLDLIINERTNNQPIKDFSLEAEFPFPMLKVITAEITPIVSNETRRLAYDQKLTNLSIQNLTAGTKRKVSILAKAVGSLESQTRLPVTFRIQYVTNGSIQRFNFTKTLYSFHMQSYLDQILIVSPEIVEGGDKVDVYVLIANQNSAISAFNLTVKFKLDGSSIDDVNCTKENFNQTFLQTNKDYFTLFVPILKSLQNISCSIYATAAYNNTLGGRLKCNSAVTYYNKAQKSNLYPIESHFVKFLNVSSIYGVTTSSRNLSMLQNDDVLALGIVLVIPRSVSSINVTVNLPTYTKANRAKRSISATTTYPLLQFVQNKNVAYTKGSAITFSETPVIQKVSNAVLNANFGKVTSLGAGSSNASAASIRLDVWLKVANDSLNIYGWRDHIVIDVGNTNIRIPVSIIGPMLNPVLNIQKTVQILDTSKESPTLKFVILVKHSNESRVDAVNVTINDFMDNIAVHSRSIQPQGKLTLVSRISMISITAFVARLSVGNNITLVYTGAFMKSFQSVESKHKASASWRSVQVNNAVVGNKFSQETCLHASKKIVTKADKSYTMILLGVAAGIIFGILAGLLILFCMRRTRVAKTYIFLDESDEKKNVEAKMDGVKEEKKGFRLESIIGQSKQKQKSELQKVDRDKWALMIAAKCDTKAVEKSRSCTLIEELIRGYDNSFKFFVDSLVQVITVIASKLRSSGDISAENLRKVQYGASTIASNFTASCKEIDHQLLITTDHPVEVVKQYLENQCASIQTAKTESLKLFLSMIPATFKEDQVADMRTDFEDLQRAIFAHSNTIRAQAFLHVKGFEVMQAGYKGLLVWTESVFYLWCKWISKKLSREIDILQRKRAVSNEDANIFALKIKEILEQGEKSYKKELHKKAVTLQREITFDCWAFFKTLSNELQLELQKITTDSSSDPLKSVKDGMELIKKRCLVFLDKTNAYGSKAEEEDQETWNKTLDMIKKVRTYCIKDIIGKIELLTIKHFSRVPAADKAEAKSNSSDNSNSNGGRGGEHDTKEEAMRAILEGLEDIQADHAEAQTINESSLDDFLEEVQASRADTQALVSMLLEQTEKLIEEPIVHCKFQFKSLLYSLRDLSLPKIKSALEAWSSFLQLTLTEIYIRNDLKKLTEIKSSQLTDPSPEENVIFWFKSVDSITGNEFEKTRKVFRGFIEQQNQQLREVFNEQIECLKNIAKDYIFRDLQEDGVYIRKISCLKTEFLIIYQFLVKILHDLDDKQHLSDPEVKECFLKFDKAVKTLIKGEDDVAVRERNVNREEVMELLRSFQKDCESLQLQQNSGASGKIDQLLFDEEGVADKISKLINNRQQQDAQIETLEKLQLENFRLLSSLREMGKIPDCTIMVLVQILHCNVAKERLDEIMASIDGPSERDYYAELIHFQNRKDNSDEGELEAPVVKPNKKRKKGKTMKKNAVGPKM